ncbi:MAG: TetR/AcrR family transcriptional regulator [Pseudomonadota bacterium]
MNENMPKHMARGHQRRQQVLELAVGVATAEGLEALTIGRVADISGFTKAGLLGHFNSKEELQLATLKAGRASFLQAVIEPAHADAPGMQRMARLLDRWVEHIVRVPGGCFFASVAAEFDGRGGPVRDSIAAMVKEWIGGLEFFLKEACDAGHLEQGTDVRAMAFRLHGYELSLNLRRQLFDDEGALQEARGAMHAELRNAATRAGRRLLEQELEARR